MKSAAYINSLPAFIQESKEDWLKTMINNFQQENDLPLDASQVRAWDDCGSHLLTELADFATSHPQMQIIFEYRLPYGSDRRPDVLLIDSNQVIILEFKQKKFFLHEDIDQAAAYARDLQEYHSESRRKKVTSIVVLTKNLAIPTKVLNGTLGCSIDQLAATIQSIIVPGGQPVDIDTWINSNYEPLPTIVQAAQLFMKQEPLPNIRRVDSTGIPQALERLKMLTNEAKNKKKHIMALVTGVPGAGKTFLGLKYVYDICVATDKVNSVYLSGNGPLIKVLSDALGSRAFVESVHNVVNEFLTKRKNIKFNKNIMVFDEGQRAWDKERIYSRNKNKMRQPASEPTILTALSAQKLEWSVMLILVGEGQEINQGEDKGIEQWSEAIDKSKRPWDIVCPEKLGHFFAGKNVITDNNLDLNTSLRSYLASDVSRFINYLIAGQINEAKSLSSGILEAGFNMYVTRDLETAKAYCRNRYANDRSKRYGMMASSKAYALHPYGMKPAFQPDVATWFNGAPENPKSSNQLQIVISEFDCQGLEVDMPLIGWADDLLWTPQGWLTKTKNHTQEEIHYRFNSYRVLLTRGRDGFVIFIPNEAKYNSTYQLFLNVGMKQF